MQRTYLEFKRWKSLQQLALIKPSRGGKAHNITKTLAHLCFDNSLFVSSTSVLWEVGTDKTVWRDNNEMLYKTSNILLTLHAQQCHWEHSVAKLFNPFSPKIHTQILQTDLHIFPSRIGWENLFVDQSFSHQVIISLIPTTFSLYYVSILKGEN